jgi:DNA-binding PadR family transcriptional regulator
MPPHFPSAKKLAIISKRGKTMQPEPMTLYKLMILYMLKKVNFPLTNSQLSAFFLSREYTTFFTLQQALSELMEAKLIRSATIRNSTQYEITPEGEETFQFFGKKVSPAIIEDMDTYIRENRFKMRNEVGTTADYYKSTNQDYIVQCDVNEGKSKLISLSLSVPDESQAELMCSHWKENSKDIYAYVMKKLLSESKS